MLEHSYMYVYYYNTASFNYFASFSEFHSEVYDFEIDSEGHVMEGYLFTDLQLGDRINVNLGEGKTPTENGRDVKYIRLMIRKSKSNVVSWNSL
jgi:hypothetical protein